MPEWRETSDNDTPEYSPRNVVTDPALRNIVTGIIRTTSWSGEKLPDIAATYPRSEVLPL
jgi:hypothetical protein